MSQQEFSRRNLLKTAAATATIAAAGTITNRANAAATQDEQLGEFKITKKRIHQSVMGWCFNPMPTPDLMKSMAKIGFEGIEGVDRKHYKLAKELGLKVAIVGSHGFAKGPVNTDHHNMCVAKLKEGIDVAVEVGSKNVITFTGMRVKGMTDETAIKNCIACWRKVTKYAEEKGVNLVLEHLNSRDDTHPMKGHPGYFGDDVDLCVDIIKKVDSPRMKLLFDVYHVQVMNGDVIRRIGQYKEYIAHYHTAGNPGRCEIDDNQEINYPPILKAILDTGYEGFVAQEFIPTWDDKLMSLRHAAQVCDI